MNKIFDNFVDGFSRLVEYHQDWVADLPVLIGFPVILMTASIIVLTPAYFCVSGIASISNYHDKNICLESARPRRYHSFICEEYKDGEWVQVDPSEEKLYYYNEEASEARDD